LTNDAEFYEEQKFTQKWILVVLCIISGGVFALAVLVLFQKKSGVWPPILMILVVIVFVTAFRSLTLQCKITGDAIAYRFFPLQGGFKVIRRSVILNLEVVTYKPLSDYGGWGIRMSRKGMAYTVKGDKGLLITLDSQKNILIGTSKPEEMRSFLKQQRYL
jgi:hypothetical protein